jgi:hypothetical protein
VDEDVEGSSPFGHPKYWNRRKLRLLSMRIYAYRKEPFCYVFLGS